jgi:hypothetical protein
VGKVGCKSYDINDKWLRVCDYVYVYMIKYKECIYGMIEGWKSVGKCEI